MLFAWPFRKHEDEQSDGENFCHFHPLDHLGDDRDGISEDKPDRFLLRKNQPS